MKSILDKRLNFSPNKDSIITKRVYDALSKWTKAQKDSTKLIQNLRGSLEALGSNGIRKFSVKYHG